MLVDRHEIGDRVRLAVSGRLDAETTGELTRMVDEELRRGVQAIALDLAGVVFLSSAGIRGLFEMHRAAAATGGTCLVGPASEPVRKVLELTRLAPLLMDGTKAGGPAAASRSAATMPVQHLEGVSLVGLEPPSGGLRAVLAGSGGRSAATLRPVRHGLPRHACGLGLAALADDMPAAHRIGELVAACGAVFHRPPQPFAAVDFLVGTGDLVPAALFAHGIVWHGLPSGRAGFEPPPASESVALDDLVAALAGQAGGDAVAVVVAGEVHGLVGVELIRPLTEAVPGDSPQSSERSVAASWLSFSREPVHARRTALAVGVATPGRPVGPLADFLRPLGRGDLHGHFHAVVFPLRPLRRGPLDLDATVADLAASEPLAVMHLLADPEPILGSGRPAFVRGSCWFAPLSLHEEPT